MSKLTPEFPPHIKPHRRGVYKTRWNCWGRWIIGYSYWTGKRWGATRYIAENAYAARSLVGGEDKHWRGLAADPEAKC